MSSVSYLFVGQQFDRSSFSTGATMLVEPNAFSTRSRTNSVRPPNSGGASVRNLATTLFMGLALLVPAASAHAQDVAAFPNRTIRIIVPYPPGGSTDTGARVLAGDLSERLRQPVIIENRGGAAGSVGTELVARSTPDGYTMLFHTSVITTDPTLKKNLSYDVMRDLIPVTIAASGPYLLVINPSLPVTNVAELIAYAKANPGKLNYGSAGLGSSGHMIGEWFKMSAGIDMVHVPYRGGAPSIVGLMSNDVQLVFDVIPTSKELAESGKLRALAVTSAERAAVMPSTPTMIESGVKDFAPVFWLGAFLPAGTPQPIVEKLHRAFAEALASPAVRARLDVAGLRVEAISPAESAKVVADDIVRWRKLIEDAKINVE
jgi:tripartite-type tricarboxylate transporter receptor subunit TctC